MKNYILLACLLLTILSCGKSDPQPNAAPAFQFPNSAYAKVVAYHFEDNETHENIITKAGKLNHTVKKEQLLDENQIKQILSVINDKNTYGGETHRCFEPRLGLVFYDQNEQPKGHISICFQCNNFVAKPNLAAPDQFPNKAMGFSEKGRAQLVEFCKSLSFGQCGTLD